MLNINEKWKPIKGFSNYEVSDQGRIKSQDKVLKTYKINSGYDCIKLTNEGKRTSFLIHRLVALHFLSNEYYPEVNHKNGIKSDNRVVNLEWVTSSENKQHAFNTGLKVYNRPTLGLKHKSKASKYHNVGRSRDKWVATVRYEGVNHFQKRFDSEVEAALHVNWILDTLGLTDRPHNIID